MEAKGKIERAKKEAELDKKIKAKKATEVDKQMELKTFDHLLENRIQNEIAKRIDKAHNYSFNLANYKSAISDSQLVEWTEALKHIEPNGVTTVEEVYKKLSNSKPESILQYLVKLNPINALEADIAREYVSNMDNELIIKHKELKVIKDILKSGAKYPTVSIKETCTYEEGKLATQATEEGVFPFVVTAKERKTASEYQFDTRAVCIPLISSTGHGSATLKRIHYQEGKFALANLLFAAVPNYPDTELYPKYLYHILDARREELFCPLMKGTANVSMKMENAINVRFPLPDIETQKQIVTEIEKLKAIIDGAEKIFKNWEVDEALFKKHPLKKVGEYVNINASTVNPEKKYGTSVFTYVDLEAVENGFGKIDFSKLISGIEAPSRARRIAKDNSVIISTVRPNLKGFAFVTDQPKNTVYSTGFAVLESKNVKELLPKFIFYSFMGSRYIMKQMVDKMEKSSYPSVNQDDIYNLNFNLPDIEIQQQIVADLDAQTQILEGLRKMKAEAEKKIEKILADVWGLEYVETIENNYESEEGCEIKNIDL